MANGLFELHWTKVATFERCRKQYWYKYVRPDPWPEEVESPQLAVGKAVHRAMKTLCDTGEPEDGSYQLETFLRMPSHESAAPGTHWYELAVELYAAGTDAHHSIASEDRLSELNTGVPAKAQGVMVRTTIDRADRMGDGSWLVIDWKTGSWDPAEDTDRQLDLGHLALRTIRPQLREDIPVRAIAWNLRTGKQRTRVLSRDDARRTRDWAVRMAQRLQSTTDFTATPSRACSFCAWESECEDAEPDLSWLDRPDAANDGEDLFDPLLAADDELLPFD